MQTYEHACPRILTFRPPRIAMTLLLLATVLQMTLPLHWLQLRSLPVPGISIGSLGFLLMIRAWWLFRVENTAICPTADTTTLITTDVYKLTRNPMYLGIVLIILGVALATGSVLHYAAASTFFAIIDHSFCPYEEQKLRGEFADDFALYTERVRRWL